MCSSNFPQLLNLIFYRVKLRIKNLIFIKKKNLFFTYLLIAKILKKLMLYQIKLKKKLLSSLFNEEKLLNLIFYQVKLEKELILRKYLAGKL